MSHIYQLTKISQ